MEAIAATRARCLIMDISGAAVLDTAVANYLIKITKATRLMGCETTISGLSPEIAISKEVDAIWGNGEDNLP